MIGTLPYFILLVMVDEVMVANLHTFKFTN